MNVIIIVDRAVKFALKETCQKGLEPFATGLEIKAKHPLTVWMPSEGECIKIRNHAFWKGAFVISDYAGAGHLAATASATPTMADLI